MSAASGLLTRLGLRQAACRAAAGGHSARRSPSLGLVSSSVRSLSAIGTSRGPISQSGPSALLAPVTRRCAYGLGNQPLPRRFYSSDEGIYRSPGEMKIAVIGQSMFGQEVCTACFFECCVRERERSSKMLVKGIYWTDHLKCVKMCAYAVNMYL